MYTPKLVLNYPAIVTAALVYFALGWLWFGPLFGKLWVKEMGFKNDYKPDKSVMVRAMILTVIGCLLTSFVLTHAEQIWRPSVWDRSADSPDYLYGVMAAFFTWIGYYVPLLFMGVAYENRSWKFFGINASYHFAGLLAAGEILTYWR